MAEQTQERLWQLLQPVVEAMGYEFVGVEFLAQGRRSLLRVYIDAPNGVTVDDCEQVSYQVSGVLEVEDFLKGAYTLEVSSPGFDRPLFTLEQFRRYCGQRVQLRLGSPHEGRRRVTGELREVRDASVVVVVEEEGAQIEVPFELIEKARLVPAPVSIGRGRNVRQ